MKGSRAVSSCRPLQQPVAPLHEDFSSGCLHRAGMSRSGPRLRPLQQHAVQTQTQAGNVRAEDLDRRLRDQDCYDWEQIRRGSHRFRCGGGWDKNGSGRSDAPAGLFAGCWRRFSNSTPPAGDDYSLSIGLTGNASVSGRLFGLPVTQVRWIPPMRRRHTSRRRPFRLILTGARRRNRVFSIRHRRPDPAASRRWRETPSRKRWAAAFVLVWSAAQAPVRTVRCRASGLDTRRILLAAAVQAVPCAMLLPPLLIELEAQIL